MAETLITLGIIGIVAALIMPQVILNVRNQKLKAQFKTAHYLVANAVYQMGLENGDIVGANCGYNIYDQLSMGKFNREFRTYFKDVKTFGGNLNQIFRSAGYKNGTDTIKNPANNGINVYLIDGGVFMLKNGMTVILPGKCVRFGQNWKTPHPVGFLVDINGAKKGPNRIGFDIFEFQILRGNRLNTQSLDYTKEQSGMTPATWNCNYKSGNADGFSCTLYAILDKSPLDGNKPYFESLPAK